MIKLLPLAMVLAACGAEEKTGPAPGVASTPEADPKGISKEPEVRAQATLVADASQLPPCEDPGRLVYVAASKVFKVCEGDGAWTEVDLKGAKGEDGKAGADGAAGAKGETGQTGAAGPAGAAGTAGAKGETGDTGPQGATGPIGGVGATGAQGVAGAKGDAGQTVTDSMWWDPVASRYWTFSTLPRTWPQAQSACTGDWQLPTATEVVDAVSRGLTKVATNGNYWTSTGAEVTVNGDPPAGGSTYILCVQVTP